MEIASKQRNTCTSALACTSNYGRRSKKKKINKQKQSTVRHSDKSTLQVINQHANFNKTPLNKQGIIKVNENNTVQMQAKSNTHTS